MWLRVIGGAVCLPFSKPQRGVGLLCMPGTVYKLAFKLFGKLRCGLVTERASWGRGCAPREVGIGDIYVSAITKYHRLAVLNDRHRLLSSGGWKAEIRVPG